MSSSAAAALTATYCLLAAGAAVAASAWRGGGLPARGAGPAARARVAGATGRGGGGWDRRGRQSGAPRARVGLRAPSGKTLRHPSLLQACYSGSLASLRTAAAGCDASSVGGALLALAALLLGAQGALAAGLGAPPRPRSGRGGVSRRAAAAGLAALAAAWGVAGTAFAAAALTEAPLGARRAARAAAAAACVATAAATTHGLVGPALHLGWRFVQPLSGGVAFVALQTAGWAATGGAVLALAALARAGARASLAAAASAASLPLLAQAVLAVSLLAWRREVVSVAATAPIKAAPPGRRGRDRVATLACILLMYAPTHATAAGFALTLWATPVARLPLIFVAWAVVLSMYYAWTGRGDAAHAGRPWPAFQAWVAARAPAALTAWHGGCEVVWDDLGGPAEAPRPRRRRSGSGDAAPSASPSSLPSLWHRHPRLLFGYAPHGLYPLGLLYLWHLPGFKAVWGPRRPPVVPLVASAVLASPVLRDLAAWMGARVVARRTLLAALERDGAVALVPGGQAELTHHHRLASTRQLAIVRKHAGFVRAAIAAGAALVPVLALGEAAALADALPAPPLKRASLRAVGFPIPFVLSGRWWVSPLPRAGSPLRFVVGPPLPPPPGARADDAAAVAALSAAFYDAVAALFARHAQAVGWGDVELVWADAGPS